MIFCNINFNIRNKSDLFERESGSTKCIITANAQLIYFANTIERFLSFMNNNYVTFDGTVPLREARRKNKEFYEYDKLSGSDIVYDFCQYSKENNLKVFFLGGKEESNKEAVNIIKHKYGIQIEGFSPHFENYPFSDQFQEECASHLSVFKPDILFIGFGSPKQEFFIEDKVEFFNSIGIKYVIGSGGTFEFVSGKIHRAPKFIQKMGLEGLYRFLKEPNLMRIKRIFQSFKFYKYINNDPDFIVEK